MTTAVRRDRTDAPDRTPFLPRSRHGDRRRWHDGPTPVSLADLTTITRQVAAEVAAGMHEVRVDHTHRWSRRLHADPHLDVWLISWATEQAAELHDHGGSIGALTVVRGELTEWRWTSGRTDDAEIYARGAGRRRAGSAPADAGGLRRGGLPARARARRVEPPRGARGERPRVLAAAVDDVLLRRRAGHPHAGRAPSWSSPGASPEGGEVLA